MKRRLFAAILVVLSSSSFAKVTYDDAIKADEQLNAVNPHLTRTNGFTSTELSQQTSGDSIPYLYGGVYQQTPRECRPNAVTGSCSCPAGYSAQTNGIYDSYFVYCWKLNN
ncbi:hypothetical protein Q5N41_16745 [Vibrio cholerae]|uniref:hypothetical protein n=1 Tax=Vibrio cholerae TaxID=666 RepID=UPI0007532AA5|nr:hypothetical protein [Vibrio cholerae]EII3728491.1 hypothetical protein [Vibrio cholerae]EJL6419981.1 hypothetical protein [Vibrio cholerae]EJL6466984.1 hypothetical protein [Vibrio cholerae]EJL6705927.1 hypothetical protein [Vibrio cholerae]EJL9424141.1 hypothetical protein [Vibrio cholerae]